MLVKNQVWKFGFSENNPKTDPFVSSLFQASTIMTHFKLLKEWQTDTEGKAFSLMLSKSTDVTTGLSMKELIQ